MVITSSGDENPCLPSAASVDNYKQVQHAQAVLVRGREREGEIR